MLIIFTVFYLLLAIFSNWFRFSLITAKLARVKNVIRRNSFHPSTNNSDDEEEANTSSLEISKDELVKDQLLLGEALEVPGGDVDMSSNSCLERGGLGFDVTREVVDENGQLVISSVSDELTMEGDRSDSESNGNGEVIGGSPPPT